MADSASASTEKAEPLKGLIMCARCNHTWGQFVCSKCKNSRYCSKECQKAHWKEHKKLCKAFSEARKKRREGTVQGLEEECLNYQRRSLNYLEKGEWAKAEKQCRYILEKCKGWNPNLDTNLGCAVMNQGRIDEAMELFQASVAFPNQEKPALLGAYMYMGDIYLRHKHNVEAAKEAYRKALEVDPEYPPAKEVLSKLAMAGW